MQPVLRLTPLRRASPADYLRDWMII